MKTEEAINNTYFEIEKVIININNTYLYYYKLRNACSTRITEESGRITRDPSEVCDLDVFDVELPAKIKIFLCQVARDGITSGDQIQKRRGPVMEIASDAVRVRTGTTTYTGVLWPVLCGAQLER